MNISIDTKIFNGQLFMLFRDGTSIILSDDVGQLYILNTGQGESQQDAQYDQVFGWVSCNLFFFPSNSYDFL